jgi:hypothetical protein
MKRNLIIIFVFIVLSIESYTQIPKGLHPIKGQVFFNISEIDCFKGFELGQGGSAVEVYGKKKPDGSVICDTILILMLEYIPIKEIGSNKRKIIDYLILTNKDFKKDYSGLAAGGVELNGKEDVELFVIYKYEENEYFTKIYRAWRADRKLQKIYEVNTKGLRVVHEGFEGN